MANVPSETSDTIKILWAVGSFFSACTLVLVGVLWKVLMKRFDKVDNEIEKRTLVKVCDEKHNDVDCWLHRHAHSGAAGEVVEK